LLLEQLSNALGPSGCEDEVRRLLARTVRGRVDELRTDALGNLIAFKRGKGIGPRLRVMVDAHMDEVGFMITRVEKNGLLGFRVVGGIDARLLPAKRVLIGRERVPGVILAPPIHLTKPAQREQVTGVSELVIDIGATSDNQAREHAKIGDYAAFATRFQLLSEGGLQVAKGKAFDDRAGCTAAASLVDEEYDVDLYLSFSTQEEVGLRGAQVAAYGLQPDIAFALEGTICDDMPKKADVSPTTRLGQGPAITLMDRSFIADRRLVQLLVETAARSGIPFQFKQPGIGGTDAGAIHQSRSGVPSVALAVPCRYIHTPVSLLSLLDLDNLVKLVKAALHALPVAWGR